MLKQRMFNFWSNLVTVARTLHAQVPEVCDINALITKTFSSGLDIAKALPFDYRSLRFLTNRFQKFLRFTASPSYTSHTNPFPEIDSFQFESTSLSLIVHSELIAHKGNYGYLAACCGVVHLNKYLLSKPPPSTLWVWGI